MRIVRFALVFCLLFLAASSLRADRAGSLIGRVWDAETGDALPGASVVLLGTGLGADTDAAGDFWLPGLPPGIYAASVSMVGYAPAIHRGLVISSADSLRLDVPLSPSAIELPALVVTGSKRARSFVDAPTTVTLLDAADLQAHNSVSLDESLDYLPGVNMVSGQVNIRGSSGYSRGTGSRVLLLIDGFPALSADNGEVKWDAIPMDQVERVEIIKGAGSALYGTGALGGLINVITRDPSPRPETRFRVLAGIYSDPVHPEWRWAESRRTFEGIDVSHSRREGRLGLVLGMGQKWTNGYRENAWYRRYKGNGKVRYEFSPTSSFTGAVNWAMDDHGVFVQWKDRNEPLEVPTQSRDDKTVSQKLNVNLSFYRLLTPRAGYRVKTFVYRTAFDNEVEGRASSEAYKFGQELQVDLQPVPPLSLTVGAEWMGDRVLASADLFGDHGGLNLAAYAQAEIQAGSRLSLSAGGRFDRHRTDDAEPEHRLSPKLGLSWRLSDTTSLRSSVGWGFRAPSIAEIYTNATFSGVPIVPNPGLKAERSLSWELGLDWRAPPWLLVDLSAFWSRYQDLIEARADPAGVVGFRNVSRGRIGGIEVAATASWRWVNIEGSYTFLDAVEYLPLEDKSLPYRSRHLASAGLGLNRGRLTLGGRFTYRSRTNRASGLFPEGVRDLIALYLVDVSATCRVGRIDLTAKVHNFLEYNYARVERNLGQPRRFSLGLAGTL